MARKKFKLKPKHASEFLIGDRLIDRNGNDLGRIMAIADHPTRPFIYFLCANEREEYTIMATLTDALCSPWLPRQVPKTVMERFLFDAYVGVDLPPFPQGPVSDGPRIPVKDLIRDVNPPQAVNGSLTRSHKLNQPKRKRPPVAAPRWVPTVWD
jgi:hypothetical protein